MMSELSPAHALHIAAKLARQWFAARGINSLNGLEPEDIAQETILSLLRTGSSFEFVSQKLAFVLIDHQRKALGRNRAVKRKMFFVSDETLDCLERSSDPDVETTSREAMECVLNSLLDDEGKLIALLAINGFTKTEIAQRLSCSKSNITRLTQKHALELHNLVGQPCPAKYLQAMLRRNRVRC